MFPILSYIIIGAFSGILAGLFGIGGGVVVVPGLAYVFTRVNMPSQDVMHMATSSSLAIIILTTSIAVIMQQRQRNITWLVWKRLAPGIILGTILGALIASQLSSHFLKIFFGLFVEAIALQMLTRRKAALQPKPWPPVLQRLGGLFIGILSAILGVGGGVFTIPVLLRCGLPVHNAAATSSACALLLGIIGTLSFMVTGWHVTGLPAGSTGYVYWPAVLFVAITSMMLVPVGIKLGRKLSGLALQRIFAMLLLIAGLDMLLTGLWAVLSPSLN